MEIHSINFYKRSVQSLEVDFTWKKQEGVEFHAAPSLKEPNHMPTLSTFGDGVLELTALSKCISSLYEQIGA